MIETVTTVDALRDALAPWREEGESVGLVPTMGALHPGHISLIAEAKKRTDRTVATIFVNPTQFGPNEDLSAYPRQLEQDKKILHEAGCDLLYAPTPQEIYPPGFASFVDPGPLGAVLEGTFRPGHFRGVATVVAKLLLQVQPDCAIFGEKDYQQFLVIQRITRDLDIPVDIIGAPTLRDKDGLALSSRNAYLSGQERKMAVALPNAMNAAVKAIKAGHDIEAALVEGRAALTKAGFAVDYLELADAETLAPVRDLKAPARLLAAAKIGKVRLIDNWIV